MSVAIETHNLDKQYREVTAVEHLSLRVTEGEIYAFLGLNGAGKTTTIRMLLGMIKPTAGTATVLGTRVRLGSVEPWASVGYLVETPHAYPELTVAENLEVARRLHPGIRRQAIARTIERLGLSAYTHRRAGTLSLGNAQRLGLARALLHDPRLLILDEPANGLDPAGIVEIRELLLELTRQRGVTVFMSSHILAEVSRVAQRIGIIHEGHLLQEMEADELEQDRRRRLLVRTRDAGAALGALAAAGYAAGPANPGSPTLAAEDPLALVDAQSVQRPDDVARLLVQAGTPPTELVVEEEELEHYFLRLVGVNRGQDG
ncbi:MAG: ABC transporter ATP-binding protein [Anaerolineae bacterium]